MRHEVVRHHLLKFVSVVAVFAPQGAIAHVGHVGELAGHGHLIGLAGLAGAALMAALLAKLSKQKKDQDLADDGSTDDAITDGDDASQEAGGTEGDMAHG